MDSEILKQLLAERRKSGERKKELKVFVAHVVDGNPLEMTAGNLKVNIIQDTSNKEFYYLEDSKFYYEEYKKMALFFTAESSHKTKIIKNFIIANRGLKRPWMDGYVFKEKIQNQITRIGEIKGYSAIFEPYNEYTDYGFTLRVWGRKSDEFLST